MQLNIVVILVVSLQSVLTVRPRYQHFEDYLNNLDRNEQSWITNAADEDADDNSEGQDESTPTTTTTTTTSTTIRPNDVDDDQVRSQDVSCCMLGQLAGDKGYHCYSQYYAARIVMRNRNRAHNRKMAFYGPQKIKNYGEKLMRTFEQCVASRGVVFHKCCHLSAMEKRVDRYDTVQRSKYQKMRHQQQHDLDDDDEDEGSDDSS